MENVNLMPSTINLSIYHSASSKIVNCKHNAKVFR